MNKNIIEVLESVLMENEIDPLTATLIASHLKESLEENFVIESPWITVSGHLVDKRSIKFEYSNLLNEVVDGLDIPSSELGFITYEFTDNVDSNSNKWMLRA